jgi:ATP-dependent Lon protease
VAQAAGKGRRVQGSLSISDSALRAVIDGYAREAGVRQLEKQLGKLVRKAVVKLLEDPDAVIKIGTKDLEPPWACRCSATSKCCPAPA